ncbi:LysR family transcriptional regulator [Limibaculum sp. M0105]|uniref:LysR family transcriptional regulator n=1 Tax=Thermohalobaculum xanthum TaxID=2753746 RepID=A0A8J7M6B9_9RHOB|nr:LysR substrate-binding domain-containing protein [Thermohalobaculum xanthum]MBK0399274.1 LysR family transcriptional regulator [Thermohalobaculum xanthum]
MTRRIPPLAALRAFEAAARHLSFRDAADELCVTQSAVSHQLRSLETLLGQELFARGHNRISLTRAGRAYLAEVAPVLDRLARATERVGRTAERLSVRATPAFAARWLIPRLDRFAALCPEVEISISTGLPPTDFSDGTDVVIHWGADPVAGARVAPFFASPRGPVASPALLEQRGHPSHPAALATFPLLRDEVMDGWSDWFLAVGAAPPDRPTAPSFAHCELAMNAAESGQGVALAYLRLVERELADGRLVRLFDGESGPYLIYSVACPADRQDEPVIAAFRDWITAEGRAAGELPDDRGQAVAILAE